MVVGAGVSLVGRRSTGLLFLCSVVFFICIMTTTITAIRVIHVIVVGDCSKMEGGCRVKWSLRWLD